MEKLPEHGSCFVCGVENPRSIGVTWFLRDDGAMVSEIIFTVEQQGPPGHAHGGATAAVLDEAMGGAVWLGGNKALAVKLNVEFHRPVPLGVPVTVVGRVLEKDGRKVKTIGEARLPDGEVAVSATGLFVDAGRFLAQALQDSAWDRSTD